MANVIKDQPLNEEQLKCIFKKQDKNRDGCLSRKELKKAFEELGSRIPDKNGDECLSRKELKEVFEGLGGWIPGWRASSGLCNADANGDGSSLRR
ncbi:unnamed protein product [Camellia sinensis]